MLATQFPPLQPGNGTIPKIVEPSTTVYCRKGAKQ